MEDHVASLRSYCHYPDRDSVRTLLLLEDEAVVFVVYALGNANSVAGTRRLSMVWQPKSDPLPHDGYLPSNRRTFRDKHGSGAKCGPGTPGAESPKRDHLPEYIEAGDKAIH
jgi:hypothetical protein